MGPDYVIVSILRPTALSIPIIIQILMAYKLNRYAFSFAEALCTQALHCSTHAAAIAGVHGLASSTVTDATDSLAPAACTADGHRCLARSPAYAKLSPEGADQMELARLDRAAEMLSALAAEIQAEAESRPMRVILMKAEPASASLLISGIMSIIALQIYGARAMI